MGKNDQSDDIVASVVEEERQPRDGVIVLSTGVRARIKPVPYAIMSKIRARFPRIPVPKVWIEEKQQNEPWEGDPDYVAKCEEREEAIAEAVNDAIMMKAVELVDGVPEDNEWAEELIFLNVIDSVDFPSPRHRELAYLKYIAVAADDMRMIMERSSGGFGGEGLRDAEGLFRSSEAREADRAGTD